MPANPVVHDWFSYSQCDDDGIIRFCLGEIAKVEKMSQRFLELGCSDGYSAVWYEGA